MKIILTNKQNELLEVVNKGVVLYDNKPVLIDENIKEYDIEEIYGLITNDENIEYYLDTTIDISKYNVYVVRYIEGYGFKCTKLNDIIESIQQGKPIGFKALDKNMCAILGDGMQYEIGKEYSVPKENLEMCEVGFHFSLKFEDAVWNYDNEENVRMFKVVVPLGSLIEIGRKKCCSDKIILSEEIDPEKYIIDNNINLTVDKFRPACFKYSNKFLESLIEKDLQQAFRIIKSQLDVYEYEDDDLLDKLMDKVRKSDKFTENDKNNLTKYSPKRALELVKELDIKNLNLLNSDTIKALPESYFRKNEKELTGIRRLGFILTPELCFDYFNEPLIQRYIKEGNADFYIFNKLFKEKNDWFVNNPKVLDEYCIHVCVNCSEDDFKKYMVNINNSNIFKSMISNRSGIEDFELFKMCFVKAKLEPKDYKKIIIKTGEQLKFVISKCGDDTLLISEILKTFKENNIVSKNQYASDIIGIGFIKFNLHDNNDKLLKCYSRYYSKKLNKMSRKNKKVSKKVLKMIRREMAGGCRPMLFPSFSMLESRSAIMLPFGDLK